ncbi:alpha/beta-Hydrolases superfamily protein [Artemisia annua]|uniref:Alpha/beta-Hydrolases superfamily protein n=1 Tax=Artemisia annua TaxID=35608 RepID=A0A2U1KRU8_ARTAN|nr:alpha/beta-Hydrolases superfamily protein [Artemisia annua]
MEKLRHRDQFQVPLCAHSLILKGFILVASEPYYETVLAVFQFSQFCWKVLGVAEECRNTNTAAAHHRIKTNGIWMHVAEIKGGGLFVLLLHGFHETWFSWRHQMAHLLAMVTMHVVSPDLRG